MRWLCILAILVIKIHLSFSQSTISEAAPLSTSQPTSSSTSPSTSSSTSTSPSSSPSTSPSTSVFSSQPSLALSSKCKFEIAYDNRDFVVSPRYHMTTAIEFVFIKPELLNVKFSNVSVLCANGTSFLTDQSIEYLLLPFEVETDLEGRLYLKHFTQFDADEAVFVKDKIINDVWPSFDFFEHFKLCFCSKSNENAVGTNETSIENTQAQFDDDNLSICSMNEHQHRLLYAAPVEEEDLPESIDWYADGYLTKAKNQGTCKCCWAFVTVGLIEFYHRKEFGELIEFSEQSVLDCKKRAKLGGCDTSAGGTEGGTVKLGLLSVMSNGIYKSDVYPWAGRDQNECKPKKRGKREPVLYYKHMKEFLQCSKVGIDSLRKVLTERVVAATVYLYSKDGGLNEWDKFEKNSGILTDECRLKPGQKLMNHAILLVGYGVEEDGREFYRVKNSHGKTFGVNGYGKLDARKGYNSCLDNFCAIF